MAKNLYIDAILRSEGVKKGAEESQRAIDNMATLAKKIIGGVTVTALVLGLKNVYTEASHDATAFQLMSEQMRRVGASSSAITSAKDRIEQLRKATAIADDQQADALNRLVTMTGNVNGSVANLNLVLDIAAQRKVDLATASTAVANAMKGEGRQMAALFPELKQFQRENEGAAGSAAFAAEMLKLVEERVGGYAVMSRDTAIGATQGLADAFGELKEKAFAASFGVSDTKDAINKITAEVERSTPLVLRYVNMIGILTRTSLGARILALGGGGASTPMSAYSGSPRPWEVSPDAMFPRLVGTQAPGGSDQPMENNGWKYIPGRGWVPPGSQSSKPSGVDLFSGEWNNERRGTALPWSGPGETGINRGVSGMDLDAAGSWMSRMRDLRKQADKEQQDQINRSVAVATQAFAGLFNSMRGGWKSTVDWMFEYFAQMAIQKLAGKLALSMFGGGEAGAVGGPLGALMGLDKSYGSSASMTKVQAMRAARGY